MKPSDLLVPFGLAGWLRRPVRRDGGETATQIWHDETQVRLERFAETLAAAPRAALVPLLVSAGLAGGFWTTPYWVYPTGLLAFAIISALATLIASRSNRSRTATSRRVMVGSWIAAVWAAFVGFAWGTMPIVLFASTDAERRLLVLGGLVVLMADVGRVGPLRRVQVCFLTPIAVGGCVGLALGGSAVSEALAAAAPLYAWLLLAQCRRSNAAATRRIVDAIRVTEQSRMIHELLLDFDEVASDWIWRTDVAGRFTHVSYGGEAPVGWSAESLKGATFATLFARERPKPATKTANAVLTAFSARKPFRNQLVEITAQDPSCWLRLSGKPIHDDAGQFLGYRGIGTDMTVVQTSETRIAHLANFDALTGFANRTHFQDFVRRQCAAAAADGHCRALLSLDLDGFKSVNDSLGHEGGDELLRQVAARLTATAPTGTFIARLGGDEFALWMPMTTPSKAEALAAALAETLGIPFAVDGLQVDIGASVGIAYTPKHSIDPDDLLTKADLALYRAKAESKGKACVFAPTFETALLERRKLEGDLKLALARGEFTLHYQPIVDVALGRVVSFEALIRWQSPDRGFVSPVEFIPPAETMGLITPIGRWVLFEACRTAAGWPYDVHVSVNVSPPHLKSPEFLQDVAMALKTSGLHPSRLAIEVTEGVFLESSFGALDALKTLRTRGVRIALDDFGTGYSSLNYLVDFPVDKIKIDRSFVRDIVDSHANQAIVDAMLGLARKLSIRVTAEGVETKEQALALKRSRCDEFQGYLFSKPRPGAEVADMIASVPTMFRDAVPTYMDSPLAMAFSAKKATAV